MIKHEEEFNKSLEFYQQEGYLKPIGISGSEGTSHNVALLYQWIYQVTQGKKNNMVIVDYTIIYLEKLVELMKKPTFFVFSGCQWHGVFNKEIYSSR